MQRTPISTSDCEASFKHTTTLPCRPKNPPAKVPQTGVTEPWPAPENRTDNASTPLLILDHGRETSYPNSSQLPFGGNQSPADFVDSKLHPYLGKLDKLQPWYASGLRRAPELLDDDEPTLLLQPVTKSISAEQLRKELKSIYSGLVMVENKCKDVDQEQTRLAKEGNSGSRPALSSKQWQALIALHKSLHHEYHDFFLASQHPAATPNLTKLSVRNQMPARLWHFGFHNFLELLRYRLPESLEYMLAFIYTAYSMMTLLYETVPAFSDIWVECLGDLGRYRIAIEDDNRCDKEIWSNVSQNWYRMAFERSPENGRLLHYQALLSPPCTFEQLSLYLRSLISTIRFQSAETSILTILNPAIEGKYDSTSQYTKAEILLIKLVAVMHTGRRCEGFSEFLYDWKKELMRYIFRQGDTFRSKAVSVTICTIAGLYEYGRSKPDGVWLSLIRRAEENHQAQCSETEINPASLPKHKPLSEEDHAISSRNIKLASSVAFATFSVFLSLPENKNVYPAIHEYFVMVGSFIKHAQVMALI